MQKKIYIVPEIEIIRLDNEIALALQSPTPPEGIDEGFNLHQLNNLQDPYKALNV
jgi:hypothetical protein